MGVGCYPRHHASRGDGARTRGRGPFLSVRPGGAGRGGGLPAGRASRTGAPPPLLPAGLRRPLPARRVRLLGSGRGSDLRPRRRPGPGGDPLPEPHRRGPAGGGLAGRGLGDAARPGPGGRGDDAGDRRGRPRRPRPRGPPATSTRSRCSSPSSSSAAPTSPSPRSAWRASRSTAARRSGRGSRGWRTAPGARGRLERHEPLPPGRGGAGEGPPGPRARCWRSTRAASTRWSPGSEISMCGFVPATIMVVAAVAAGAREAELVRYANSGDVTGDDRQRGGLRRASSSPDRDRPVVLACARHERSGPRPLRPLPHRLPPHRRGPHRPLQLALGPPHRRQVRPAHRGHRPGALHRGGGARHPRRDALARPRLGRGAGRRRPLRPYFQMQRLELYREYAERLVQAGKAYACYCTQGGAGRPARAGQGGEAAVHLPGHLPRDSPTTPRAATSSGSVFPSSSR